MEILDTSSQSDIESVGDDPEPEPFSTEQADTLVNKIKNLWDKHAQAKSREEYDDLFKIEEDLRQEYRKLEDLCGNVQNQQVGNYVESTHPDAYFELWFACYHLRKVLKLTT